MNNTGIRILILLSLAGGLVLLPTIKVSAHEETTLTEKKDSSPTQSGDSKTPEAPTPTPISVIGGAPVDVPYPANSDRFIQNASTSGNQSEESIREFANDEVEKEQTLINAEMIRNGVDTKNITFEFILNEGKSWLMMARDEKTRQLFIPMIIKDGNPVVKTSLDLFAELDRAPDDDFFDLIPLKDPDPFTNAQQQLVADESGWNVIGGFVDGKLTFYYDATTNEIKLPDGKVVTKNVVVASTGNEIEIPEEWKNWKGDIRDFNTYIKISDLSDLDKLIAYNRSQQTQNTTSTQSCDLKMFIPPDKPLGKFAYVRVEYEKAGKGCTRDNRPAKEVIQAQLPVNTSKGQDTLLFFIEKRGNEYIKFVASKSYIEEKLKKSIYYKTIFNHMYKKMLTFVLLLNIYQRVQLKQVHWILCVRNYRK